MPLCASCDRCRSRKTKCDGQRPCSNCAQKYMKRNKVKRYVYSVVSFMYFDSVCAQGDVKQRRYRPRRHGGGKIPDLLLHAIMTDCTYC